jgi:hypothetical protein
MDYDMFAPNIKIPPSTKIRVDVTQTHIDEGERGDALLCPVALAIREKIKKGADILSTVRYFIYYSIPFDRSDIDVVLGRGRIVMIPTEEKIAKIIKDHEEGRGMEPFSLDVLIPNSILDKN